MVLGLELQGLAHPRLGGVEVAALEMPVPQVDQHRGPLGVELQGLLEERQHLVSAAGQAVDVGQ